MTKRWTICQVSLKHIPSFPYYLVSLDLQNSEPGKKPRATFYAISAVSYYLVPLHKGCFNLEHGLLVEYITICSQIAVKRLIVPHSLINTFPGHNDHFIYQNCFKLPSNF